jgi:2-(3-amino-3-carboxypropyl)histidine synthase
MMATVQFSSQLPVIKERLTARGYSEVSIPHVKPLSPGEVLGCTAPAIITDSTLADDVKDHVVLFIADGRFHLEAVMMANRQNPNIRYIRYDPMMRKIFEERFDHLMMDEVIFSKNICFTHRSEHQQ